MNKTDRKKLVLDVLYTSKGINRMIGFEPPLKEAALFIIKNEDMIWEARRVTRKQYSGINEDQLISDKFQKKKEAIDSLIKSLKSDLLSSIPDFQEDDSEYTVSLIELDEEGIEPILNTLYSQYKVVQGSSISIRSMNNQYVKKLGNLLKKLGRALIKKEVIDEVEREVLLNGIYNIFLEFTSVPDACNYYENKNKDDFDIQLLKVFIREKVIIYDNDEIQENWSVINKRINSWDDHENKKYSRK
tara:strand:- start:3697 stop:4431 length:735 start_codon:yes stop_codon:yes gene_type:complete